MLLPVKWNILSPDRDAVEELAYELVIPTPVAAAYVNRGLDTVEKVKDFLNMDIAKLHDPWLLPDMKKAINRIITAINNNEHIRVFGDYDVDGCTSVALISRVLTKLGANFSYCVPHRIADGYDIRIATIEKAKEDGVDLLITVDCGILAFEPAKKAKELGVDLIITDHHLPKDNGEVPDCIAVVDANRQGSKYPFKDLAGVGVAFKLMWALVEKYDIDIKTYINNVIEYVALGTVADVAPMTDENRIMVYLGCLQLAHTKKKGVEQLLKVAGITFVNTTAIGFFIGPRINAIGRLADANIALELLMETDTFKSAYLATQLDSANKKRQDQQEQTIEEAKALIPEDLSDVSILVLAAKGWHPGLVGLVAGKVAEEYARPTLVCTIYDDGTAKGSCRSTRAFHILNALKSEGCHELFNSVGGHAFAAGFTLKAENIDLLRERLNEYAKKETKGGIEAVKIIDVDATARAYNINEETYSAINKLAPFGIGNPEPLFMARNLEIVESSVVGNKHLKLKFLAGEYLNKWTNGMWWRNGDSMNLFIPGVKVDVVFKLNMEEYQGHINLSMIIEDMRISDQGDVNA